MVDLDTLRRGAITNLMLLLLRSHFPGTRFDPAFYTSDYEVVGSPNTASFLSVTTVAGDGYNCSGNFTGCPVSSFTANTCDLAVQKVSYEIEFTGSIINAVRVSFRLVSLPASPSTPDLCVSPPNLTNLSRASLANSTYSRPLPNLIAPKSLRLPGWRVQPIQMGKFSLNTRPCAFALLIFAFHRSLSLSVLLKGWLLARETPAT